MQDRALPSRWVMGAGALAIAAAALFSGLVLQARAAGLEQIKMVVGFPAGSGIDSLSRIVAERVRAVSGTTMIVDNRSGGGGRIGAEFVAHADPDGTTILSAPIVTSAFTPFLYKKLSFDPKADFTGITRVGNFQFALAVNKNVPVNSVREFIDYVKAHPGKVSYGSLGAGTPSHFLGVMFNRSTGTDLLHVPYRGSGPAMIDLQGGQVQASFITTIAIMQLVKQGELKALAVTGTERSANLPDVPTFKELHLGLGAIEDANLWYGFLAPSRTPAPVVAQLNHMLVQAIRDPTVRQRLSALDIQVVTDTPEEFAKVIDADYARWGEVIRSTGFTLSE